MLLSHVLGLGCLLAATNICRAAISVDANVSVDQATANTNVVTSTFSTSSGNELLLAFISTGLVIRPEHHGHADHRRGLTWTLVVRTNGQSGTSEIWRAFASGTLSG